MTMNKVLKMVVGGSIHTDTEFSVGCLMTKTSA